MAIHIQAPSILHMLYRTIIFLHTNVSLIYIEHSHFQFATSDLPLQVNVPHDQSLILTRQLCRFICYEKWAIHLSFCLSNSHARAMPCHMVC